MSITPRASSIHSLSPANRLAGFISNTTTDSMAVEAVEDYAPLLKKGASFYYEDLLKDKNNSENDPGASYRYPKRISSALLTGTTKGFMEAFSLDNGNSTINNEEPSKRFLEFSTFHSIAKYELMSNLVNKSVVPAGNTTDYFI